MKQIYQCVAFKTRSQPVLKPTVIKSERNWDIREKDTAAFVSPAGNDQLKHCFAGVSFNTFEHFEL